MSSSHKVSVSNTHHLQFLPISELFSGNIDPSMFLSLRSELATFHLSNLFFLNCLSRMFSCCWPHFTEVSTKRERRAEFGMSSCRTIDHSVITNTLHHWDHTEVWKTRQLRIYSLLCKASQTVLICHPHHHLLIITMETRDGIYVKTSPILNAMQALTLFTNLKWCQWPIHQGHPLTTYATCYLREGWVIILRRLWGISSQISICFPSWSSFCCV